LWPKSPAHASLGRSFEQGERVAPFFNHEGTKDTKVSRRRERIALRAKRQNLSFVNPFVRFVSSWFIFKMR